MYKLILLVVAIVTPSFAYAYVDPGAGLLFWQGILAACGAILVLIRNPKQVIKSLNPLKFFKKKGRN